MKIKPCQSFKLEDYDCVIFGVSETGKQQINGIPSRQERKLLGFSGKLGEVASFIKDGRLVVLVGLGKKKESNLEVLRKAAAKALWSVEGKNFKRALLYLPHSKGIESQAIAEGLFLSKYKFDKYLSDKNKKGNLSLDVFCKDLKSFELGKRFAQAENYARDLVNEPANFIGPEEVAKEAKELSKKYGFEIKIYKRKDLEKMQMVGILSVSAGSSKPPRFIHIHYKPQKPRKSVAIVGKGVTFDSGGLNIKPESYMKKMKMDKAGACAVLGIMQLVGELKPDVEVHALIPAVENMPDGKSYRPDDILVYKNGKSVEIHSTDAEGRLILADALIYASELSPDITIDMATLTGACVVALGRYTSGLFSDDEQLAKKILEAAERTGEKMWRLPLDEDLEADIKGKQSDIINVGKSRYGGAITAALFLKNFVSRTSWAHIDIAGPAFLEENWKYYRYGATGQPVRAVGFLLTNLL